MKRYFCLLILSYFFVQIASSQICYTYDDAGNRTQRSSSCSGGTGDGRMMMITDAQSIATDTIQNLTASIYPNPTAGEVNIVLSNPVTIAQIAVTDNTGRQLYNATTGGSTIPINLANFAQGVYFITVKTGGQTFKSSIVKQ